MWPHPRGCGHIGALAGALPLATPESAARKADEVTYGKAYEAHQNYQAEGE